MVTFLFIAFPFFLPVKSYSQTVDSTALKIVESHLKLISDCVKNNNRGVASICAESIKFLTNLTGISSEAGGGFAGPRDPTKNDYKRWIIWLSYYKTSLKWDSKKKVIIIHKEVEVPNGQVLSYPANLK